MECLNPYFHPGIHQHQPHQGLACIFCSLWQVDHFPHTHVTLPNSIGDLHGYSICSLCQLPPGLGEGHTVYIEDRLTAGIQGFHLLTSK